MTNRYEHGAVRPPFSTFPEAKLATQTVPMPLDIAKAIYRLQVETAIPPHILAQARVALMKEHGLHEGLAKEPLFKKIDDQIQASLYLETFGLNVEKVKDEYTLMDWKTILAMYAGPGIPVDVDFAQFVSTCRNAAILLFIDQETFTGAFPKNTIQSKGARVSDLWRLSRVKTLIIEDPAMNFILPEKREVFYEEAASTDTAYALFQASRFTPPSQYDPISLQTLLIPHFTNQKNITKKPRHRF